MRSTHKYFTNKYYKYYDEKLRKYDPKKKNKTLSRVHNKEVGEEGTHIIYACNILNILMGTGKKKLLQHGMAHDNLNTYLPAKHGVCVVVILVCLMFLQNGMYVRINSVKCKRNPFMEKRNEECR